MWYVALGKSCYRDDILCALGGGRSYHGQKQQLKIFFRNFMEKEIIILTPPIYVKRSDVLSQTIYNIFERGGRLAFWKL